MTGKEEDAGTDRRVGDRVASMLPGGEVRRARIALWVAALALVAAAAYFAWQFAGTLVLGLFVYYVTRPIFERIHLRIGQRTLAVVVSLLTIALPVLLLVGWTLVIAVQAVADFLDPETRGQLEALVGPYLDVTTITEDGEGIVRGLLTDPAEVQNVDPGALATGAIDTLLASVSVVATAALHAFIVLVIAFYLLRDDHRLAAWSRRTFAPAGGVVETFLVRVDRELKSVFFGNILNALFTGVLAVTTFLVLDAVAPEVVRIPQPALLGLLVGAASLVPAVGIKLVTVPVGVYLLARSALFEPSTLWFPATFFLVSFVVVDYIPDQLLRPYVSGRNLHVGAVMLAYLFGPLLFGWYGIFLGPLLLVVGFEFAQVVVPWLMDPETDLPSRPATAGPANRNARATRDADDPADAATTRRAAATSGGGIAEPTSGGGARAADGPEDAHDSRAPDGPEDAGDPGAPDSPEEADEPVDASAGDEDDSECE